MKLGGSSVRKTIFILHLSLSLSLSISWLRASSLSVKPIGFCHDLCKAIVLLLFNFKIVPFSAAVGVQSMQSFATPFTSSFHHIQHSWVLPLSSSEVPLHITSMQIFSHCSTPLRPPVSRLHLGDILVRFTKLNLRGF